MDILIGLALIAVVLIGLWAKLGDRGPWIADDPDPQYSRLDKMDGLGNQAYELPDLHNLDIHPNV